MSAADKAQEWTTCPVLHGDGSEWQELRYVVDPSGSKHGSMNEQVAIRLAEAINASIAAERHKVEILTRENDGRDQREAEYAQKMVAEIQARDKQLTAEREKVQPLVNALIKIANDPYCDRCQVAVDALAKFWGNSA